MKLKLYIMEAAGLSIFMASACFFSAMLDGPHSAWHNAISNGTTRHVITGFAMGFTALVIFYLPITAPSGSHINPAVTLAFLRVDRINRFDAFWYIVFQLIGGTLMVYLMARLLGSSLTASPVDYVVTRPGGSEVSAFIAEFVMGFIMMTMVLNVSSSHKYNKFTRVIAACFVTIYVIFGGPISGFGMNPARSLASAIPSGIYTSFWIYIIIPIVSMLTAAELFLYQTKRKQNMKRSFKYHWLILIIPALCFSINGYSQAKRVEAVGMTVRDMDRSVNFYNKVLAFEKVSDSKSAADTKGAYIRTVRLKLGDEMIELTEYHPSKGRPVPADMKSNDVYFQHIAIVVSDMDKAYAILKKNMASQISKMPETIPLSNAAAAGIRAFYFHDPDHHDLEVIYFPQGKGQPKWQNINGKLFLGIDHTAIGVTSTKKGLNFYKNLLGFDRKGDSWNKGMEQMDLSDVKGASLHITGLRAKGGPGVEFLQYLVPGPGKPFPKDTKVSDMWYWQITVVTDQPGDLYKKLDGAHYHFIKRIAQGDKGIKYFIVQDPDGHALKITE